MSNVYSDEVWNDPAVVALRYQATQPYAEREEATRDSLALRSQLASIERSSRTPADPPIRCRVLMACFQHRDKPGAELRNPAVDEIITLPKSDAQWMAAIGRVEIIK